MVQPAGPESYGPPESPGSLMRSRPGSVLFLLGTMLVLGSLSVRLSMPPRPLPLPHFEKAALHRGIGRPQVQTARHLPPNTVPVSVHFHSQYDWSFLRGLNINDPRRLDRIRHRGGVPMGTSDPSCDDGKTNLTRDWEDGSEPHLCPADQRLLDVPPKAGRVDCQRRLPDDIPLRHVCMNESLSYSAGIPTYGHHRPLWPVYGSYRYLPPQRWLHSIEHGAVVLLHHPCVDPDLLRQLRSLVQRCIFKHIVTPSWRVERTRPLVLVAHGCTFQMARVSTELVVAFIRRRALAGKEGRLAEQGQFRDQLTREARAPLGSDVNDTVLCPFYPPRTASDQLFDEWR
ncbi:hypothetical protein FJT64_003720 [Amphibalanus amphitrite]|uniref:Uncharacterized protein n=1 Tax=Amphibalanus amphitrite TaxID=1232801 RepID=A0A6A4W141_AMPAM|nr:uncharacterized protein LOC122385446 [Amphibalanus amphitrite]KAF0298949.1 hypothetical protein FJT64_003720 [Amphibalanus amphitrite]